MEGYNNSMKDKKVLLAEFGILMVAMFWGMGFVSAKLVLKDMDPFNLLAYRYGIAFIIMIAISVKSLKLINKKTFVVGSIIGVIMFAGNMIQTFALQYTTPGKQTFITCTYTVIVPLLSWVIFKERVHKKIIISAVIAVVGIGFLTLQKNLTIGLGDGMTFVFAVSFSFHVILVGRYAKDFHPVNFALVQMGVCAILAIITSFALGSEKGLTDLHFDSWMGMLQLVFLNTIFAFILQNACQKIAPPSHAAIIMSTETIFGTIFSIVFVGEVFTGKMIIGCVLMFIALVISNIPSKKENEKTLVPEFLDV